MTFVLTLIAAPGSGAPIADCAAALRAPLGASAPTVWLKPGEACDLIFEAADGDVLEAVRAAVAAITANTAIDAVIQPQAGRRKRLLIADMDSTIIEQECLDEIAAAAGIGPQVGAITERAMRGELDFAAALRERIALLKGFPERDIVRVLEERITLTSGARRLVTTMRAHGARTVLVSGGFTLFTGAVAARAGFDADYANRLILVDGAIAGVAEPILGREAKLAALQREAAAHGIPLAGVLAVGDGANDLAMIKAAGLGVAFRAKPVVAAEADATVRHGDLTALLYAQGYGHEAFAGE